MSISEKRTAMVKVPCGGFKLDNNFLGMNENDELSLTGGSEGKAYQYLVTDGEGNTVWEDRLAYDDSKPIVDAGHGAKFVKVADEVPSWVSVDAPMKVWMSNGESGTLYAEDYLDLGNGSFSVSGVSLFIMTDNFESNGVAFPGKGVYFISTKDDYTTGIASADSDTPELTWDGNIGGIKKLDEKFLPDMLILYVHEEGVAV